MVERTRFVTAEDKNMESDPNINELIPPEVLLQVLEQLPPRSLLSAVLVCRLWLDLAHQAPQLWTWVHLTGWLQLASMFSNQFSVWPPDLSSVFPLLSSPRFASLRRFVTSAIEHAGQEF